MRWREIPKSARRYIIYHTMLSPFLATWYMFPVYMFKLGYSVLEAGLILTIVDVSSIPLVYMVGKMFDRIPIRHGLVLIDTLDGVENVLYGLAAFSGKSLLVIGMIFGKITKVFYPLYQVTEKILYPKDKMEEIFSWHMRLPLLFESLGTLAFGYIFGNVFTRTEHYALGFMAAGVFSVFSVYYLIRFIPAMEVVIRKNGTFKFKFDREFGYIVFLDVLNTLSSRLAPNLVFFYYLIEVLKMDFFWAMMIVSAANISTLPATYISERIDPKKRFPMIGFYFLSKVIWASLMLIPRFFPILLANIILEFSGTLAFPFYRSWIFEKIPKDRAGEILAAISSFRRSLNLVSPLIAGALATVNFKLPYVVSIFSSLMAYITLVMFA